MTASRAVSLLLAAPLLGLAAPIAAQQYPSHPIRLIVPWPPGGITDVISRGVGIAMSESLGQQIVADNRPGAAGTLGVAIAAKANPDGYTLLMTDVPSHAISASLYKSLPYNPLKDIEPVALPSRSPMVLVVNPKFGVRTIAQLIDYAKKRPGEFAFASSGSGSITHLAAERFNRDTGIKTLHVPYKGGAPATAALIAGEAGMYFSCISAAIPHIKSGPADAPRHHLAEALAALSGHAGRRGSDPRLRDGVQHRVLRSRRHAAEAARPPARRAHEGGRRAARKGNARREFRRAGALHPRRVQEARGR